ncbi:MAG: thioesterase family protein [Alphaproteobacteria bacterium]
MKDTLKPGVKTTFSYTVEKEKTVPFTYPESAELREFPEVFASGFMISLMEWTCLKALRPHMAPDEGSVGVHFDISHVAATPAGLTVTVEVEVTEVSGQKVWFHVRAHDGFDMIGEGYHERYIVQWPRFYARVERKNKGGEQ